MARREPDPTVRVSRAAPWILGIAASHNGGACLLHGDEIAVAVQEERLLRNKRTRIRGACDPLSANIYRPR